MVVLLHRERRHTNTIPVRRVPQQTDKNKTTTNRKERNSYENVTFLQHCIVRHSFGGHSGLRPAWWRWRPQRRRKPQQQLKHEPWRRRVEQPWFEFLQQLQFVEKQFQFVKPQFKSFEQP
jgi:hypothetical protein